MQNSGTVSLGVARYARHLKPGAPNRETTIANYAASREAFGAFMDHVKRRIDMVRQPLIVRQERVRLASRLYKLMRKSYGSEYLPDAVEVIAHAVAQGMTTEHAMGVLRVSAEVLSRPLDDAVVAGMQIRVEECLSAGKEIVLKTQDDVNPNPVELEPEPEPDRTEELAAELRATALKLLKKKVGDEAEKVLPDVLARAGGAGPRRKRGGGPALYDRVTAATALERVTRRRAEEMLREALGMHQSVVKECVALRLCKRLGYDEIARELELTREDVEHILSKLRPWVRRFTTFFDTDWYWVESAKPDLGRAK